MAAAGNSGCGKPGPTPMTCKKGKPHNKVCRHRSRERRHNLFLTRREEMKKEEGEEEEEDLLTARQLFEGAAGPLPHLLVVGLGYYFPRSHSHLFPYESQKILFAYKQDRQFRVLFVDCHRRSLSLPLQSALTFRVDDGTAEELTLSELVSKHCLPVRLRFARPHELFFVMDRTITGHASFEPLLLTAVYEEPFYWCLSIKPYGGIENKLTVLPKNLLRVGFAPVTGIRGAWNPSAKLKEFVKRFSSFAETIRSNGDPFFQDLAIVSRGPTPVTQVEPYIDDRTFISVLHQSQTGSFPRLHMNAPCTSSPRHPKSPAHGAGRREAPARRKEAEEEAEEEEEEEEEEEDCQVPRTWPRRGRSRPPVCNDTVSAAVPSNPGLLPDSCTHSPRFRRPPAGGSPSPPPLPPRNSLPDDSGLGSTNSDETRHALWKLASSPACPRATRPPPPLSTSTDSDNSDYSRPGVQDKTTTPSRVTARENHPPRAAGTATRDCRRGDDPQVSTPPTPPPAPPPLPSRPWKETLSAMSVHDIAERLERLGLRKYRKKFCSARIDGVLLLKLTEDTLREEFQMQNLELLRLGAFVSDGHIPRRTKTKST
ncbi:uncharacterized protein LOC143299681 [Babylonia areolata]|uniref:uncharacterized protein LOC143299681 n=1 Tax=Babylonia areolata TaxID=304850 RepID=UPI003FD15863